MLINDSYRMVFVNVILVILLSIGVFLYHHVYPKKRINLFLLLIIISIAPLVSILRQGSYESGDLSYHATFAMAFFQSLKEGNIIPHWAGILNSTYGYPLFIFIYPLPYYIISFFHLLGFGFIDSVKVLLIFAYILSGIFAYLWAKTELSKTGAFVTAIFYLFAPYHLIDLHFRVDVGEVLAFAVVPLSLLLIKKFTENKKFIYLFLASVSLGLLILSHNAVAYISFPFLFAYSFFSLKDGSFLKRFFNSIKPFFLGLLYSAYFWIPALYEGKFTYVDKTAVMFPFPSLWSYLYSPWRYGLLFQGPTGGLATIIGYAQVLIIILSIIFLIKGKIWKKRSLLILFLDSFVIYFFLMQKPASFLYNIIPLLGHIQFTYRILSIISLFTALIAGIFVDNLKSKYTAKIIILIIFAAIVPTILNWGARRVIPAYNDNFLIQKLTEGPNYGESFPHAIPKWVDYASPWQLKIPANHLEILNGFGEISEISRTSTDHLYTVNAKTNLYLKENTYYFPGWIVRINGVNQVINYQNELYPGIITFNLEKGSYTVEVLFRNTFDRKLSFFISVSALLISALFLLKKRKFNF